MAKEKRGNSIRGLPYTSDILEISIELGLPPNERHLLHLLRSYMNEEQKQRVAWPSQMRLAEQMGISDRQVRRLIKNVESMKIISIAKKIKPRRKYGNNVSEYRFIFPWKTIKPDMSNRTSVSGAKPDICDSQTGHGCPTIKPRVNNKINQSLISQDNNDDDVFFNNSKKKLPEEIETETELTFDKVGKQLESFERSVMLPEPLKRYYSMKSLEKVDLSQSAGIYKRYDLLRYVDPFTGQGNKLLKDFGTDYSGPMPDWWEKQFNDFYKSVITLHWQEGSTPNEGFKTAMRRACISGIMQHYGFTPKTSQQVKEEKQEAERRAREKRKREEARRKKELAKKKEQDRKNRNLIKIYQDLVKDNWPLEKRMFHLRYLEYGSGELNRKAFKALIIKLHKTGKLKKKASRETWIVKLREAILDEAKVKLGVN